MKNTLTQLQRHEVSRLLDKHCRKEDGFAVYEEGWTDTAISEIVGLDRISGPKSVGYIRTGVFGPLWTLKKVNPPEPQMSTDDSVRVRLAILERDVSRLMGENDALSERLRNAEARIVTMRKRNSVLVRHFNSSIEDMAADWDAKYLKHTIPTAPVQNGEDRGVKS